MIFGKKEPVNPFAFVDEYTDEQIEGIIEDTYAVVKKGKEVFDAHDKFFRAAYEAVKGLGMTFIMNIVTMEESERETYVLSLAQKWPQVGRIANLIMQLVMGVKVKLTSVPPEGEVNGTS